MRLFSRSLFLRERMIYYWIHLSFLTVLKTSSEWLGSSVRKVCFFCFWVFFFKYIMFQNVSCKSLLNVLSVESCCCICLASPPPPQHVLDVMIMYPNLLNRPPHLIWFTTYFSLQSGKEYWKAKYNHFILLSFLCRYCVHSVKCWLQQHIAENAMWLPEGISMLC